jgi:methionine S-methyltransferase
VSLRCKHPFALQVYGLDINPRAVKVSWINLYLNALDEKGQPIYDEEKKTLLDRVEFHESDLLSYCRENSIQLERIVGCIPQVLSSILECQFFRCNHYFDCLVALTCVLLPVFFFLQILNPNPDAMSKMITENASEEFLHSLSNYCALQVASHL